MDKMNIDTTQLPKIYVQFISFLLTQPFALYSLTC